MSPLDNKLQKLKLVSMVARRREFDAPKMDSETTGELQRGRASVGCRAVLLLATL